MDNDLLVLFKATTK